MRSPILFIFLLSTSVIIALAHHFALSLSLYWKYPWFDILMHFFGGVVIGLLFLVLLLAAPAFDRLRSWGMALLFVLVVGLLWEWFEILAGISPDEPGFVLDTIIDLCMDMLGGALGYWVGKRVSEL